MMFDLSPPLLAIYIPLVGALLIALAGRWPNLREALTLGTAGALLYTVASIVPKVLAPNFWAAYAKAPPLRLIEVLPDVFLELKVEPLGMVFALIASSLWVLNSLYSIGYMRGNAEKHQTRFYVCFALAISQRDGPRLRRQPLHPVRLLRDADPDDLPAGRPQGHRGGASLRPDLPRHPRHDLGLLPARRHHRHLRLHRRPVLQARAACSPGARLRQLDRPRRSASCSSSTCTASARPR
jgi:hypothetical protein